MYLLAVDGPGVTVVALSDSSSMGVIGGGGVPGGEGEDSGLVGEGEGGTSALRALRERWDRREREEPPAGDPTVLGIGVMSPPAARRMLPRSLPYGGGGARVPELGARPHFLTLASMNTNPD